MTTVNTAIELRTRQDVGGQKWRAALLSTRAIGKMSGARSVKREPDDDNTINNPQSENT